MSNNNNKIMRSNKIQNSCPVNVSSNNCENKNESPEKEGTKFVGAAKPAEATVVTANGKYSILVVARVTTAFAVQDSKILKKRKLGQTSTEALTVDGKRYERKGRFIIWPSTEST